MKLIQIPRVTPNILVQISVMPLPTPLPMMAGKITNHSSSLEVMMKKIDSKSPLKLKHWFNGKLTILSVLSCFILVQRNV
jgi:hypothetical protein